MKSLNGLREEVSVESLKKVELNESSKVGNSKILDETLKKLSITNSGEIANLSGH